MAVSKCPVCGKKILVKHKSCLGCGHVFSVDELDTRTMLLPRKDSKSVRTAGIVVIIASSIFVLLGLALFVLIVPYKLNSFDVPYFLYIGGSIFIGLGLFFLILSIVGLVKVHKNRKNKSPCLLLDEDKNTLDAISYNEKSCSIPLDKFITFKCNFFTDYMIVLIYMGRDKRRRRLVLGFSDGLTEAKKIIEKKKISKK